MGSRVLGVLRVPKIRCLLLKGLGFGVDRDLGALRVSKVLRAWGFRVLRASGVGFGVFWCRDLRVVRVLKVLGMRAGIPHIMVLGVQGLVVACSG